jgi:hypothetical protein
LDEYLALSGSTSRKYAIFKLNRIGKTQATDTPCVTTSSSVIRAIFFSYRLIWFAKYA